MTPTMLLIEPSGNAVHPFPCHIDIERRQLAENGEAFGGYVLLCDGKYVIAKYHDFAPAKMELLRLRDAWNSEPRPAEFRFMEDVKQ